MAIDTYGRITRAGTQWRSIDAVDLDPVMFVDTQPDGYGPSDVAARIRSAPPTATAAARYVVLRVPQETSVDWRLELCAEVAAVLHRLAVRASASVIALPVGDQPWQCTIEGDEAKVAGEVDRALLGRCRRVELTSMLVHNNGIWNPSEYHFRLPSGAHGTSFIRVADAIRTPLDALGVASWLGSSVTDSTGLLLDSASLVGVATALDALVARSGRRLGPVVSLEEYPKNRLDTMKAVRDVDRGENVLAVLSVHSTGSLNERLTTALDQVASTEWSVQILVDKSAEPGGETVGAATREDVFSRIEVWTRLGKQRDVPAHDCESCRKGPARVAQIDPRTFDGMVLPTPEMLTPSTPWAFGQRRFWELADAADAVSIDAPSDVSGLHPRYATDKLMNVKIDFRQFLADGCWEANAEGAQDRLAELLGSPSLSDLAPPYDLILVDDREAELPNFGSFLGRLTGQLGDNPEVLVWPNPDHPDSEEDGEKVRRAEHILLFRLGLVSGLSMQQTMYRVQQRRRGTAPYEMDGLIVHLRPQDGRVRETLRNSLAHRMASLWESYLPEERDPFQEEIDLLTSFHGDLDAQARAFQGDRLAMGAGFPAEGQLLWGAGPHDGHEATRLSPMSWFGEGLRVRAAYVSIGSAVQHARMKADAPRSAPVWRMFEMPAILRSYYDPIIVCCILRWLRPTEVWWGEDMSQASSILQHLWRRTGPDEQVMLLSELMLAAAQSKVPEALTGWLRNQAELLAEAIGPERNAPLLLGRAITAEA